MERREKKKRREEKKKEKVKEKEIEIRIILYMYHFPVTKFFTGIILIPKNFQINTTGSSPELNYFP